MARPSPRTFAVVKAMHKLLCSTVASNVTTSKRHKAADKKVRPLFWQLCSLRVSGIEYVGSQSSLVKRCAASASCAAEACRRRAVPLPARVPPVLRYALVIIDSPLAYDLPLIWLADTQVSSRLSVHHSSNARLQAAHQQQCRPKSCAVAMVMQPCSVVQLRFQRGPLEPPPLES